MLHTQTHVLRQKAGYCTSVLSRYCTDTKTAERIQLTADADILFYPCGFFFLFSSPILSCWRLDVYHTCTCGLSMNLEGRSEMCCRQLAENTGCKKSPKICHLHIIAQHCWAISSQLRHVSTIGQKC